MKKNIIRISLLSLILVVISFTVTTVFGRIYTLEYNLKNNGNNNYNLIIDNEDGKVEVIEKKVIDNKLLVKIKAKKPGKVYLYLDSNGLQTGENIYIHKNLVITENSFFGKSTGSEVIPIALTIILLYTLYLLIKRYKECLKENVFQYKNIAYLGIIIFLSFFIINNFLSLINYQGLYATINKAINSMSLVSFILLPISFVTFILVTISNINLIRKEGKSLRNMLGLFLGIFICVLSILPDKIYSYLMKVQIINIYNLNSIGPYAYNFFEALVYLIIAYLECVLIATIVIAIKSIKKKVEYNKDYMIILGCKVRNDGTLTPLLRGRVDRAIEFRNNQLESTGKDLVFIPSGGKGSDEVIAEAEAIKNYLLEQGIKDKNIIVENKSKNTYENIKFSNKLIKDKNANIAFSTTNYHVLRAGLIASEQGLKIEGVGSKTKSYFWINAFIREFIGTLYSEKKKHLIFFSLLTIVLLLMIVITYFGNNL